MNEKTESSAVSLLTSEIGYDLIEDRLRASVRTTIETKFEEELADFLGRIRYGRGGGRAKGYRHGHRARQLTSTFGNETVRVPRGGSVCLNTCRGVSKWIGRSFRPPPGLVTAG